MKLLSLLGRFTLGLTMCVLIALLAGPAVSAAVPSSILGQIPETTEEQVQLKVHLSNERFEDALLLWDFALSKHAVNRSDNGRALRSYLLFQSGLETEGINELFQLNAKKLSPAILKVWREAAHPNHFIWRSVEAKGAWSQFFGEPRKKRPLYSVSSTADIQKLQTKIARENSRDDKAWMMWQLALGASIIDQNELALQMYDRLLNQPQAAIARDHVHIAKARTLFQMGKFSDAITSYALVSKSSDFWLEAVEERAWAEVRRENYDQALSHLKTLLAPVFAPQVGPEPHFMSSLVAVQRCDFPLVFKSFESFKSSQKPRLASLNALKNKKPTDEIHKSLDKLAKSQLKWSAIGAEINQFPHLFYRDELLIRYFAGYAQAKKEARAAGKLAKLALKKDLKSSELKSMMEQKTAEARKLSQKVYPKIMERLSQLAQEELAQMSDLLQKQHVIEAEAIQRMYIFDQQNPKKLAHRKAKKDQLVFPDNGEIWLDELTHYQVTSKGCPKTKISSASLGQ